MFFAGADPFRSKMIIAVAGRAAETASGCATRLGGDLRLSLVGEWPWCYARGCATVMQDGRWGHATWAGGD